MVESFIPLSLSANIRPAAVTEEENTYHRLPDTSQKLTTGDVGVEEGEMGGEARFIASSSSPSSLLLF
jgi:hypothetical protein